MQEPRIQPNDLEAAFDVVRKGGVIIYPTETIWGIGCDATCDEAVKRIFRIKRRADSKAMISLVSSLEMLGRWVMTVPEMAKINIEKAEGPLTIIYDFPRGVAPSLMAPDGSAAFRITSGNFASELCRRLGRPLVSTSANFSGCTPPSTFSDIDPELLEEVDYVAVSERENSGAKRPSSILKITDSNDVTVIR